MGENNTFNTLTISVFSSQTLTECYCKNKWYNTVVNRHVSKLFWNLLEAGNSAFVYNSLNRSKSVVSLRLNKLNIVWKGFANHCMLFLFTSYNVTTFLESGFILKHSESRHCQIRANIKHWKLDDVNTRMISPIYVFFPQSQALFLFSDTIVFWRK